MQKKDGNTIVFKERSWTRFFFDFSDVLDVSLFMVKVKADLVSPLASKTSCFNWSRA